jgi:general secretion pathway protein D
MYVFLSMSKGLMMRSIILMLFILSLTPFMSPLRANDDEENDAIISTTDPNRQSYNDVIPFDQPGVVSLALQNADVATVMKGISQLGNYDFVTKGQIIETVNLTLKGRSIREALDIISDSTGTEYRLDGNIITVFGDDVDPSYTKTYSVMKGNARVIGQVISDLLQATMIAQVEGQEAQQQPQQQSAPGAKGQARVVIDRLNGQVVVTAVPSDHRKVEQVWEAIDIDRPPKRYDSKMFELKFITPDIFVKAIKFLIPGIEEGQIFSFVESQGAGGDASSLSASQKRLIIQETPSNLERIDELLAQIDVPPRQVVIDVKMIEFSLNKDDKLGVDWKSVFTHAGRSLPVGELFSPLSGPGESKIKFGSLGPDHMQIILDFVKTNTRAKVLSNPQITALDGKTAVIDVSDQIPYRTAVVSEGITVSEVLFKDAGVKLEVTPVIFKNDFVNLTIKPTISSQKDTFDDVPVISKKETDTTLNIRNNHTVIMGGLISHSDSQEEASFPVLGQVPGIRRFFRRDSSTSRATELVFLITPKIYSEFETHPHDRIDYKFVKDENVKPLNFHFVDRNTQNQEYSEFRKRSNL